MKYAIKLNLMYLSFFKKINEDIADTEFSRDKKKAITFDSLAQAQQIVEFLGYPENMTTIIPL